MWHVRALASRFGIGLFAGMAASAFVQCPSEAQAAAFKQKVLYSFCSQQDCADGANPAAGLIDANGVLYGTTYAGGGTGCGGGGCGTVFSLDLNTGIETVLHSFSGGSDGAYPNAALIAVDGMLYGTTTAGGGLSGCGSLGCGTVFAIDPSTGAEEILYSFCVQENCADGAQPWSSLIAVNGSLYGTTLSGGNFIDGFSYGTVFSLNLKTGAETAVYSFCSKENCIDGAQPLAGLIESKGMLYGTTATYGSGAGTVFAIDPNTGAETVLYSFASEHAMDGMYPAASLLDVKGTLYGTTQDGGSNTCQGFGCGTAFTFNTKTGSEAVLYSFGAQQNGADGLYPQAGLIDIKGKLYGTAPAGGVAGCGSNGCGTVFSIDRNTGIQKVLYTFCTRQNCADGANPAGGLLARNGKFYGTTGAGGAVGKGAVFVLKRRR